MCNFFFFSFFFSLFFFGLFYFVLCQKEREFLGDLLFFLLHWGWVGWDESIGVSIDLHYKHKEQTSPADQICVLLPPSTTKRGGGKHNARRSSMRGEITPHFSQSMSVLNRCCCPIRHH